MAIDEIKSRGYLLVGLSADFPPFEFVDENGNIVGFDVDLAKEIARRLGVELKIVDMTFDGLIPSLLTKKIDVIISGMTITEERKKVVAFSDPYFDAGGGGSGEQYGIAVRKEDTDLLEFINSVLRELK
uniref:Amino acid ABC transporter, periplasmic amino acid-binding protein,Amino acid ABC transporter, periplasmic amino acid-binding protein n=2 Tax=Thermotoga maritima (strain ATCC 43589 / DSM 3109 / JCM 10099 / NBRC 100826 / MSB8) TaxID=243274 RepID=UPI0015C69821|nr:Chain A, Amino acid ABC transporter, periplasmic amino acid-binding protein,Amino acid ABC transporter, periplasmic amino acid-binding protein [Thermotoga maritima MSB8]6Y16_B Chain B, Amino acid ABC transporter, periplasmic amino acid-binding protein,Amino acid ABC transporter, periplasmic amino acid-binding protein [Thermotoga maritima MSB8]